MTKLIVLFLHSFWDKLGLPRGQKAKILHFLGIRSIGADVICSLPVSPKFVFVEFGILATQMAAPRHTNNYSALHGKIFCAAQIYFSRCTE